MKKPFKGKVREFTSVNDEIKYYSEQLFALQKYILEHHIRLTTTQLDNSQKRVDYYHRMIKVAKMKLQTS